MVDLPLRHEPAAAPVETASAAGAGDDALRRIVTRVLAWQHRQPLARRITAKDVVGVGIIALPYAQSGAPGAQSGELQPLFHQPRLLPGLSHRALADFAARHAVAERPGPADWPRRDIERADASSEPAPATRYLLTAAVNDALPHGVSPRRLLLAPGGPAVWGRRAWSRLRVGVAAGGVLLLAMAWLAWGWSRWTPTVEPPPAIIPDLPASTAQPASPMAQSGSSPISDVENTAASAVAVPSKPATAAAPDATIQPTDPPGMPPGPHYALVSEPAKKRELAEATLQRVHRLLGPAMGRLQAQIMPSPQGYVVTIWPLPTQADAEHLAEVLARRGVPMKWMEF